VASLNESEVKKWQPKLYQQYKKMLQHHNQGKTLVTYESFKGIEHQSKPYPLLTGFLYSH
jgi:hypothetical protein